MQIYLKRLMSRWNYGEIGIAAFLYWTHSIYRKTICYPWSYTWIDFGRFLSFEIDLIGSPLYRLLNGLVSRWNYGEIRIAVFLYWTHPTPSICCLRNWSRRIRILEDLSGLSKVDSLDLVSTMQIYTTWWSISLKRNRNPDSGNFHLNSLNWSAA